MNIPNSKRILLQIIHKLAAKHGFSVTLLTHNWLLILEYKGKSIQIIGYDWSINSATSHLIARDKTACYELLNHNNVPAIEQKLFLRPEESEYINMVNVNNELQNSGNSFTYPVVCKPNNGTGGREVYRCDNLSELIERTANLFQNYRSVSLSPFYDFEYEYRIIVLDKKPLLVYRKERSKGSWQHNLSRGSHARVIPVEEVPEHILSLAIRGSEAINITFAAIDIAECDDHPRIIEINSGISFEYFVRQGKEEYRIAEMVYEAVILYSLEIQKQ